MEFFTNAPSFRKITIRDLVPGDRSLYVIQALDFTLVHDVIDQYLVAGNGMRMVDSSSPVDEILCSAVVAFAEGFSGFIEMLPAGSTNKQHFENAMRRALGKLDLSVGGT